MSRLIFPVVVFMATLVVFSPVVDNGFVTWDDDKALLENVYYRGLAWPHLSWMFTTFYMGHYQPLSWITLAFDYYLWGMNPFGYHLTSLLLHGINAVLFYFVARELLSLSYARLSGSEAMTLRVAACFAALLFSLHPLRVESVAWVTERRDVLSGFFILCTMLCYLRAYATAERDPRRCWWMLGALIFYGLSLLSKAVGVSLPAVLVVLDVYPLRRIGGERPWWSGAARRVWREKLLFATLAVMAGIVAPLAQYHIGAMQSLGEYGFLPRVWQASFGLAFYLWKTVLPLNLSPLYEMPSDIDPLVPLFIASGAFVLGLTILLIMARRRWPAALAVWICYAAFLAPVLGFVQSGPQLVADRYSYLASLGISLLAGAGILSLCRSRAGGKNKQVRLLGSIGLCVGILAVLAVLTIKQTAVWHDSETLWRRVLAVGPPSSVANNNMGNVLLKQDKTSEAIAHYRRALEIDPKYAEAYFDLATALSSVGQMQTAIEQFETGLRFDPNNSQARYYLGRVYAKAGHIEKAIDEFRQSVNLDPEQSTVHYDLGTALVMSGNLNEAVEQFRQAIALRADYAEAHYSLGRVLAAQGRLPEAAEEFRETIRIQPQFTEARVSLSQALAEQRTPSEMERDQQSQRINNAHP